MASQTQTTKKYSFSVLWGTESVRASEVAQPFMSDEQAKAHRDQFAKAAKAKGFKVARRQLRGQCRPYWSYGVPCGSACTVYYAEVAA